MSLHSKKMGTSNWEKFLLLLWKNWVIQSRHLVQTFFEIVIPVAFTALLILFRGLVDPENIDHPTYYRPLVTQNLDEFYNKTRLVDVKMRIAYSPTNPMLDALMSQSLDILQSSKDLRLDPVTDPANLEAHLVTNNIWVGVEFPESYQSRDDLPDNFEFSLRFPSELRTSGGFVEWSNWFTNRMFLPFNVPGPRNRDEASGGQPPGYYQEGFLPMQYALTKAYTQIKGNVAPTDVPDVWLNRFPYKEFLDDPLLIGLEAFIPLIIILSLIYTSVNIVKYVTVEKEKQLKEAMKIMGLSNWLHWTAWFIKCFIFYFITASLMVVIFKVSPYLH